MSQLDSFGPMQCPDTQNNDLILVAIVGLSNLLAKSLRLGRDCDEIIYPVHRNILSVLNCQDGIGDEFIGACMERLNVYSDFFSLENRKYSYPPEKKLESRSLSMVEHTGEMFFPHKYCLVTAGFTVYEPATADKDKILETQPEAILNLINSSIPEKYLEPFIGLPKGAPQQNGNGEQCIPAIFMTMDKRPNLNFKSLSNAYCMPATVPMSLMTSIVESLITRQKVTSYEELTCAADDQTNAKNVLTVNYPNDQAALISLRGVIRLSSFNEIRSVLLNVLEQKLPCLAVQVDEITDIDNLMTNLLVNFQKKTSESGSTLCFCCIGKEIPEALRNNEALKTVHCFGREQELVAFLSESNGMLASA